jgi:hypothetical protein
MLFVLFAACMTKITQLGFINSGVARSCIVH